MSYDICGQVMLSDYTEERSTQNLRLRLKIF
jgi:hypothetical protein